MRWFGCDTLPASRWLIAGYFGGLVETLVIAILGLTSWLGYARIVRGIVLSLKTIPYVEAARAVGASDARTLFRHIFPGVWHRSSSSRPSRLER